MNIYMGRIRFLAALLAANLSVFASAPVMAGDYTPIAKEACWG